MVSSAGHPHHAYLFANRPANRLKVLVHERIGIWLAALRLNHEQFVCRTLVANRIITRSSVSSTQVWCWVCRGSAVQLIARSRTETGRFGSEKMTLQDKAMHADLAAIETGTRAPSVQVLSRPMIFKSLLLQAPAFLGTRLERKYS